MIEVTTNGQLREVKFKFSPGKIVATMLAVDAFSEASDDPEPALYRHLAGDWGDVPKSDAALNDAAVLEGTRILSAYEMKNGTRFWIITEADRSATTFLLPEEY